MKKCIYIVVTLYKHMSSSHASPEHLSKSINRKIAHRCVQSSLGMVIILLCSLTCVTQLALVFIFGMLKLRNSSAKPVRFSEPNEFC